MNNQYLFNVMYYDGLYNDTFEQTIEKANRILLNYRLDSAVPAFTGPKGTRSLKMKTAYPGLLIGTGNPHSSGDSAEEIKLGFTIDYTTGLPYIPGSTVKGALRSIFKEADKKQDKESDSHYAFRVEAYKNRLTYLRETIAGITGLEESDASLSDDKIILLGKEMFGDDSNGKGDRFFDAFPVKGDDRGKLFAFDNITPHKPFKNPKPLRLLKVLPGVEFEFHFLLFDSKVVPCLTVAKKQLLFKSILLDFGIGAKTNVGFGTLESD